MVAGPAAMGIAALARVVMRLEFPPVASRVVVVDPGRPAARTLTVDGRARGGPYGCCLTVSHGG